jgi:excisionase family DNA binding protein
MSRLHHAFVRSGHSLAGSGPSRASQALRGGYVSIYLFLTVVILTDYAIEASDSFERQGRKSTISTVKNSEATTAEPAGTQFLTRSEVSRMLGVSPNTVTRWAREGRLPCQVTLGGHHRFDRELVDQLRKSLYRAGSRTD